MTRQRKRRQYGTGSVYRTADGRWRGAAEAGWTTSGKRRRVIVTASTESEAKRKLRDKLLELESGSAPRVTARHTTVKAWSDEWLKLTERILAPNAWAANRSAVKNWIVPVIGQVKLAEVSHADLRAVVDAQRTAGKKASTITRNRAVLLKMLKDAIAEGHPVPPAVVAVQPRQKRKGKQPDREGMTPEQAAAVITVAGTTLPHYSRWVIALLQGLRPAEARGLTWEHVDLEQGLLTITWQLQPLPYLDRREKKRGFRVPDDYEAIRLDGNLHLVRPKTRASDRVIPLVPWAVDSLRAWQDVQPPNPHGLVWTRPDGRPLTSAGDLQEWKDLQAAAGVQHPEGRPFHAHEIRNTTATILAEAGTDPFVITAILGHTNIETSRIYVTRRAQQARPAMEAVAKALQLTSGP